MDGVGTCLSGYECMQVRVLIVIWSGYRLNMRMTGWLCEKWSAVMAFSICPAPVSIAECSIRLLQNTWTRRAQTAEYCKIKLSESQDGKDLLRTYGSLLQESIRVYRSLQATKGELHPPSQTSQSCSIQEERPITNCPRCPAKSSPVWR